MLLAVRISSYECTWEVWRELKKLELLSATHQATLTLLSCSPNFPRASITRYTHAKHEPILNKSNLWLREKEREKEKKSLNILYKWNSVRPKRLSPSSQISCQMYIHVHTAFIWLTILGPYLFWARGGGHLFKVSAYSRVGTYYFSQHFQQARTFLGNNKTKDNKFSLLQQDETKCKNWHEQAINNINVRWLSYLKLISEHNWRSSFFMMG